MKKETVEKYVNESRKSNKFLIGVVVILSVLLLLLLLYEKQQYNNEKKGVNVTKQEVINFTPEPTIVPTPEPTPEPIIKVVKVTNSTKKIKLIQQHTVYHSSSYNRDNNLRVAAKMLSKTVILPGEEFSFFGIIGNPNAEKGFKEAGVIVNHRFATALGGGICEVATSLNTAIVDAGIKTNAQSHSVNVGYLNSTDHEATVTYDGGIDLKFTNTLKYPIMIMQNVNGGNVTTKIFKVKLLKKITFRNSVTGEITTKKFETKRMLAENKKTRTEFDIKFNKEKYYYLNSNEFFEYSSKIKHKNKVLNSLRKSAIKAGLEIDKTGNKKIAVKNTKKYAVLIKISYNSKGDVKTEIVKLK